MSPKQQRIEIILTQLTAHTQDSSLVSTEADITTLERITDHIISKHSTYCTCDNILFHPVQSITIQYNTTHHQRYFDTIECEQQNNKQEGTQHIYPPSPTVHTLTFSFTPTLDG